MAFVNRIGNVLKQAVIKHVNSELSSNSLLHLAIRSMSSSSSKVFVGGLSYGTDEPSLRDAFSQCGEVIEAKIVMDRESGRSRGFGFVTYTSNEEATNAISALDGKDLHGRQIRVNYATEKRQGFRGGYGGGGGGYGGPEGYRSGYGGGGGGYGGPEGYRSGSYGAAGAGYGGSNNYSGDGNYGRGGGGYASGNYGFGGSNNGSGSGNNYPSPNSSLGNSYRSRGETGDFQFPSGGGNAADFFGGSSTDQGGFVNLESDGNASRSYEDVQKNLNANEGEPDAAIQDLGQDSALDENYKDDNEELSDEANTRS